jgi:hypothetical protein
MLSMLLNGHTGLIEPSSFNNLRLHLLRFLCVWPAGMRTEAWYIAVFIRHVVPLIMDPGWTFLSNGAMGPFCYGK